MERKHGFFFAYLLCRRSKRFNFPKGCSYSLSFQRESLLDAKPDNTICICNYIYNTTHYVHSKYKRARLPLQGTIHILQVITNNMKGKKK